MPFCSNCGAQRDEASSFCASCGTPAAAPPTPAAAPVYSQPAVPVATSFSDYYKRIADKQTKSSMTAVGILCIVCAVMSLGLSLTGSMPFDIEQNPLIIIDLLLVSGMGLGVWLARSRTCAIILMVYAIINTIVLYVYMGTFGGWIILVAGISAIGATFKVHKAWKEYKQVNGIR